MKIALTAAGLLTPLDYVRRPLVLLEDGVIQEVLSREETSLPPSARHYDFGDAILAPGFLDIHVHGGAGHDVMKDDAASLAGMEQFLARHGVTSYLPTTVTASLDLTFRSLERLGNAVEKGAANLAPVTGNDPLRARPLGIHLEGPFINPRRCGVHEVEHLLMPTLATFTRLCETAKNRVSMITIAPELPGSEEVIRSAVTRGICVSLGHSEAATDTTYAALGWGASHATHTFNAMPALHHREPGLLGVVLSDDRFSADIIADRLHVAPEVVRLFLKVKGINRSVLISDAMSGAGMPDGKYSLGSMEVEVRGRECRKNGKLAGSVLTLDVAIQNVMEIAGLDLQSAVRLVTINPALTIGAADRHGLLAPGREADIVVLTAQGQVIKTIIGGRMA